jgi:DNA-binding XRE family transcriptional regulator
MTASQLQRAIERAGLSQRGAAKALEINERTMRKYVAGDSKIPKTVELAMLYLCWLELSSTAQRDCKPSGGA